MQLLKSLVMTGAGGAMVYCWRFGMNHIMWAVVIAWLAVIAWDLMRVLTPYREW